MKRGRENGNGLAGLANVLEWTFVGFRDKYAFRRG
jgi:hypothetical protein